MSDAKHEVITKAAQLPAIELLHPMIAQALAKATPEQLPALMEKMMDLQERFEKRKAEEAYTQALIELKRALPSFLAHDKVVDFKSQRTGTTTHYTHTTLGAMMEAVSPHLIDHGFSLTWNSPPPSKPGLVAVTAILTHRGGHSEKTTMEAPPDSSGNKNEAQAVASTATMLQRYTALLRLGLVTREMEEPTGEGEQKQAPKPDDVNTERNIKAMAEIAKAGKTKAQAEEHVKRNLENWTNADLAALWKWIKAGK